MKLSLDKLGKPHLRWQLDSFSGTKDNATCATRSRQKWKRICIKRRKTKNRIYSSAQNRRQTSYLATCYNWQAGKRSRHQLTFKFSSRWALKGTFVEGVLRFPKGKCSFAIYLPHFKERWVRSSLKGLKWGRIVEWHLIYLKELKNKNTFCCILFLTKPISFGNSNFNVQH